jgi:hypothetical protein
MKDQTVLETDPPGSVADALVGAEVLVGNVIDLSGPASTIGGVFAELTVTAVQAGEQLSPSSDSEIVPTKEALLSAQARTYHVPAVGKVYEEEGVAVAPAAMGPAVTT